MRCWTSAEAQSLIRNCYSCIRRPWGSLRPASQKTTDSRVQAYRKKLPQPDVLYESNHLLAVNKPPGWNSMPESSNASIEKCLLSHLKNRKLGGGSNQEFLRPLHRLDQPCSGILLLGKTTKASSRIQSQWKAVKKTYYAAVEPTSAVGDAILADLKLSNKFS